MCGSMVNKIHQIKAVQCGRPADGATAGTAAPAVRLPHDTAMAWGIPPALNRKH